MCEDFRVKLATFQQICALVVLVTMTAGCAPVISSHGYFPRTTDIEKLKEGSHSDREVKQMLGSPSTVAAFDEDTWYYINSKTESFAWKEPVVISRQILSIKFDSETKMVKAVSQYTIEDGRVIAFSGDVTPTRGREFSFLEQLIGNVGRVSTDRLEEERDG